MNERQFQCEIDNHRRRHPRPLAAATAPILRAAALKARDYERAGRVWARVVEPELLERTRVEALIEGTLVIAVAGAAYVGEMRRRAPRYAREVARLQPGIRKVRFVTGQRSERGSQGVTLGD